MAPRVKLNWYLDVDFLDRIFLHSKGARFMLITATALCNSSPAAVHMGWGLKFRAGVTARPSNLSRPWHWFWEGEVSPPNHRPERERKP